MAQDRCSCFPECMPAKDRTEPHWVTDREGYFIEKGLRRRQWQRQQHQENDGVSTKSAPDAAVGAAAGSKAAADATVGAAAGSNSAPDATIGAAGASKAAADAAVRACS